MEDPSEDLLRKLGGRLLLEEEIVFFLIQENVLQPANNKSPYDATAKLRSECQKWIQRWQSEEKIQVIKGIADNQCNRCGAVKEDIHRVFCARCKKECGYCRRCLIMGRVTACSSLYWFLAVEEKKEGNGTINCAFPLLTPAQKKASMQLQHFYGQQGPGEYLLWAVCGAGKTEVVQYNIIIINGYNFQ